jgi:hemoglobin-like flavoprotein
MFSDAEKDGLRESFRLVAGSAEPAAEMFFQRLFEIAPEYRPLFPEELTGPKQALIKLLACFVKGLTWAESDWKADIPPEEDVMLVALGLGRHVSEQFKLGPELYVKFGQALISTLRDGLGASLTLEAEQGWARAHGLVSQTMQMGSAAIDRDAAHGALGLALGLGERALREQLAVPAPVVSPGYDEGIL